ncbi:MAG: hypothetical protein AAF533_13060 [Acidobacteriota bacterium]
MDAATGEGGANVTVQDSQSRPRWRRALDQLMTGDGGELRGCPRHPTVEVEWSCRCCGALLDPEIRLTGNERVGLGFAGFQSAGKSYALGALVSELRKGGWPLSLEGLGRTTRGFSDDIGQRMSRGERLPPTRVTTERYGANFAWRINVDSDRDPAPSRLLLVGDIAGEVWSGSQEPDEAFLRYRQLIGKLVFVVDGARIAADLGIQPDAWETLSREAMLGERGLDDEVALERSIQLVKPSKGQAELALVISKCDLLWDSYPELREVDLDPTRKQELLSKILVDSGRKNLLVKAWRSFGRRKVGLFGISSFGFRPTEEEVRDADRIQVRLSPVGLVEPFAWLVRDLHPRLRRDFGS